MPDCALVHRSSGAGLAGLAGLLLLGLLPGAYASDVVAVSYDRQIKPLLADHCYSCHGDKKQKGQLRLDTPAGIQAGGKSGAVLVAGHPDKSTIYSRLILPKDDDDVMPAKGDQLSSEQSELFRQWILAGAPFSDAAPGVAKAPAAGAAAQPPGTPAGPLAPLPPTTIDVLSTTLPVPDASAVKALSDAGGVVRTLSKNQAAMSLDLSHAEALDRALPLAERLATNVLWLDFKGTAVTDAQLHLLPKFKNLQRLHLERTAIGDATMAQVRLCTQLAYLNLYATKVSDAGLKQLSGLKSLAHLYVWQSAATPAGIAELQKALPECEIDGAPDMPAPPADGSTPGAKKGGKKGANSNNATK